MINLTLYYREGCWLCAAAEEMLNGLTVKYGLKVQKVLIDSDEDLFKLYRDDIPVIEFDDGSALHGAIKKKALLAKLQSLPGQR